MDQIDVELMKDSPEISHTHSQKKSQRDTTTLQSQANTQLK